MNNSPICFDKGRNQFRKFVVPFNGQLASVKLVHLDGYVRCNRGNWSFWGCGENPGLGVNVEITNKHDGTPLLPSSPCAFSHIEGLSQSSRIPGYRPFSSELVLSACSDPPNVTQGQELHLWYSKGSSTPSRESEGNQKGKSCSDVYARFT